MYYIPLVHKNISVQWYNIHNQVTLRLQVSTVNGHLQGNKEHFLKVHSMGSRWVLLYFTLTNVLHWSEDDRLRSKHVDVMWLDCIYYITVLIYCCVLTAYNALYKCVNTQRDGFCQKYVVALHVVIMFVIYFLTLLFYSTAPWPSIRT